MAHCSSATGAPTSSEIEGSRIVTADVFALTTSAETHAAASTPPGARVPASVLDDIVELQVLDLVAELLQLVRAVGLHDQELALDEPTVDDHRTLADVAGAVGEQREQRRLAERVARVVADGAAVGAERADEDVVGHRRAQAGGLDLLRELRRLLLRFGGALVGAVSDQADDDEQQQHAAQ